MCFGFDGAVLLQYKRIDRVQSETLSFLEINLKLVDHYAGGALKISTGWVTVALSKATHSTSSTYIQWPRLAMENSLFYNSK